MSRWSEFDFVLLEVSGEEAAESRVQVTILPRGTTNLTEFKVSEGGGATTGAAASLLTQFRQELLIARITFLKKKKK